MAELLTHINHSIQADFNSPAAKRHRHWRHIKDIVTRHLMSFGGVSVIIAIVLIAFYLLYVVLPLFKPARFTEITSYAVPGGTQDRTFYYAMEEQHEIGMRLDDKGHVIFFRTKDGGLINEVELLPPGSPEITSFTAGDPTQELLALGLSDGKVILASHEYSVTYPDDVRLITPSISYPLGDEPFTIAENHDPLIIISAQWDGEQATIAGLTEDSRLYLFNIQVEESLLGNEVEKSTTLVEIPVNEEITHVIVDVEQQEMYLADGEGYVSYYDISNKEDPRLIQRVNAVREGAEITSMKFLSGGISILIGDSSGRITQWFPVRDQENNYTLERIRHFSSQKAPITAITPEYFRKGFLSVDKDGYLGIYHSTAHRTIKLVSISDRAIQHIAIAPRADSVLVEDGYGKLRSFDVDNEHPEVSWHSIWGKVWYESRDKPEYIWQSSSASSDFEPKFSLTPLAFGTLKAAFYAMIFAVPIAIMSAVYTAYFMAPRVRGLVKSTVEIMAALPTVILGFLAGLWFAPLVENHLPGMFLMLIFIPLSVLATAWLWQCLPSAMRSPVPDGWEAVLLVPVIIISIVLAYFASSPIEIWLFDGNMPLWLTNELGITYDQRNSLVVGIAIGFAVIPTIFSISEDAIFGVPKSLTTGSLALGATPWQTMVRVVLLTASPGIFSAVMIGLGRAVGETMIVVMATGNTAIMDMNIFQGFRALSANIAVEMPESEVGSTHYRILFLAGLVLFLATFVFNTVAELVRQRLRVKYSTL